MYHDISWYIPDIMSHHILRPPKKTIISIRVMIFVETAKIVSGFCDDPSTPYRYVSIYHVPIYAYRRATVIYSAPACTYIM